MVSSTLYAQDANPKIYGHRGCRGVLPENSIEGFQKAIELGVDGIEFDVVVNKDSQIVISHEPYIDKRYCLMPDGSKIKNEKAFNLFQMTQLEVEQFDCGTKFHSKFPEQKKIKTHKPLLQEVFSKIDFKGITILFEIKSEKRHYGMFQPHPEEYVDIILKEIENFQYKENIIFMSFDANIINEIHKKAPEYKSVYLTYSPFTSIKSSLKDLDFKPYAFGRYNPTISKREIIKAHELGIKTFAWTINSPKDFVKLKNYGIDGIITDYPERFINK